MKPQTAKTEQPTAPLPEQRGPGRVERGTMAAAMVIALGAGLWHIPQLPWDGDEVEHLHAAWLWSQGLTPYVDFFEHHPPVFWRLLRPLVDAATTKDLYTLVFRARVFEWALIVACVLVSWPLFTRLFGRSGAAYATAFWALQCALGIAPTQVRPDFLMLLLLFGGTLLLLRGLPRTPSAGLRGAWQCLVGGVLLGGDICVLTKAIFWVLPLLVGLAIAGLLRVKTEGRRRTWVPIGACVLGMAIPGCLFLAWVVLANNWGAFWRCNVVANRQLSGMLLDKPEWLFGLFGGAFMWPAVSTPLALLGAVQLYANRGADLAREKVIIVCLLGGAVLLLVLANGPWIQYQYFLLWLLAGFAGLGVAASLERLFLRSRTIVLPASLLLLAVVWLASSSATSPFDRSPHLANSLKELQYMLDKAGPGDSFVTLRQYNPVYMRDADPQRFSWLICYDKPQDVAQVLDLIARDKPRFVIGSGGDPAATFGSRLELMQGYQRLGMFLYERQ